MIGIILYIIASALFFPIAILNLIVSIYKNIKHRMFYKETSKVFFLNARNIDIFANETFPVLWNTLLRTKNTYYFGRKGETISSALGKLQKDKGLSIVGWFVVYILWCIDFQFWNKGGHCINSIDI